MTIRKHSQTLIDMPVRDLLDYAAHLEASNYNLMNGIDDQLVNAAWRAKVEMAGFEIETPYADVSRGMLPSDAHQPLMAYSTREYVGQYGDRDYVGMYKVEPVGDDGRGGQVITAVLFETAAEFNEWQYAFDDDMTPTMNREPTADTGRN